MTRLIWFMAWAGVALWSLFALLAWGALDLAGTALVGGADLAPRPPDSFRTGDPHPLEFLAPAALAFKRVGIGMVGFVWFSVSALILGVAWASARVYRIFFGRIGTENRRLTRSSVPRVRGGADPRRF